ncbi:MAG: hypothetical protein KatS3mg105_2238 [Gemmatales bacterium]|nr:MAG: hypothetical protein KatS3mg105_2238 [Gemmatales bacterium]
MTTTLTIECEIHFDRRGRGSRKMMENGPTPARPIEPGRIPRVARLMALAIRFEAMLRDGVVESYTELAALGHVTRPRISQIMNLLNLAPEIQEELLFLPRTQRGRDPIQLRQLQPIASTPDWRKQRRMWEALQMNFPKKRSGV